MPPKSSNTKKSLNTKTDSNTKTRKKVRILYDDEEDEGYVNRLKTEKSKRGWHDLLLSMFGNSYARSTRKRNKSMKNKINIITWNDLEKLYIICLTGKFDDKPVTQNDLDELVFKNIDNWKTMNMKINIKDIIDNIDEDYKLQNKFKFDKINNIKLTPLQAAAALDKVDVIAKLIRLRDKLEIPINDRPDPNIQDRNGNTALNLLINASDIKDKWFNKEVDIRDLFHNINIYMKITKDILDTNKQNKNGDTALHILFHNFAEIFSNSNIIELRNKLSRSYSFYGFIAKKEELYDKIDRFLLMWKLKFELQFETDFSLKNKKNESLEECYKNTFPEIKKMLEHEWEEQGKKAQEKNRKQYEMNKENRRKKREKEQEEKRKKMEEEEKRRKMEEEEKRRQKKEKQEKESQKHSPYSPMPSKPESGCPSKGLKPKPCETKKDYRKQTLTFHPDKNLNCQERSTEKFKKLQTICNQFSNN